MAQGEYPLVINAALTQLNETRLTVLTALPSESLTPLLMQRDFAALQESLDRFGHLQEVHYLKVDDARGQRRAEHTHPHESPSPAARDHDPHSVSGDAALWETAVPLQLVAQAYGTLHVGISTDIFAETRQGLIEQSLRNGMIGLVGLLLVIVPLAVRVNRRLGGLDAAARAIAAGDLGRRLDESGGDELGRLAVSFNRMADALGHRESALRDAKADLERVASSKYRTLFEATTDAVMLFDGYSAREAAGQTRRLLKSGRHDAELYRAMWSGFLENGSWQGEVWNRRSNGLLGVLRQPDDLDGQTHYSAASIGITLFDPQPMRVDELMKQGDFTTRSRSIATAQSSVPNVCCAGRISRAA